VFLPQKPTWTSADLKSGTYLLGELELINSSHKYPVHPFLEVRALFTVLRLQPVDRFGGYFRKTIAMVAPKQASDHFQFGYLSSDL
jgi:hypothetical protein